MDVYTEWCGPCVGMVGSLKKIKLELGGDNLHLAVCKSDTINALTRFRNKSEPVWLFASHGKIVNLMFGTNVPKLMKIITEELELDAKYRKGEAERVFYEINELLPEEIERLNAKKKVEEEIQKAEEAEAKRQRREYLTHVTDEIKAHITDIGCTIFMPNIGRDIYKKLGDPADKFELTAKERKITNIPKEHREILFLDCPNPIDEKVLDYVLKKDVIINAWKLAEGETRTPEDILKEFVGLMTNKQAILDDGGNPIPDAFEKELLEPFTVPGTDVKVPGAWTPHNRTTNAAIIYLYFRSFTELFLPPDPIPEPPHLCCIFDAYKKREITELYHEYSKDVLALGYFSSGDPDNHELLAKNMEKYNDRKPAPTDKLVIKLAKVNSNAVLAFNDLGPCYISQNAVDGLHECAKFFPKGYIQEDEEEEEGGEGSTSGKKKKKRKKKKGSIVPGAEGATEGPDGEPLEGVEEESSSTSGSPEKQSNEGDEVKVEEETHKRKPSKQGG
uniref:CSON007688 protein n=1 Tax=Culicoides sonorensis TaxID=179676 RepID=A0A336LND6_CULSO